jgi:hypothetical protein
MSDDPGRRAVSRACLGLRWVSIISSVQGTPTTLPTSQYNDWDRAHFRLHQRPTNQE